MTIVLCPKSSDSQWISRCAVSRKGNTARLFFDPEAIFRLTDQKEWRVGICLLEYRSKCVQPGQLILKVFPKLYYHLTYYTQYVERILNKTAKAINETFTGLKLMLQGLRICFV